MSKNWKKTGKNLILEMMDDSNHCARYMAELGSKIRMAAIKECLTAIKNMDLEMMDIGYRTGANKALIAIETATGVRLSKSARNGLNRAEDYLND